MKNLSVTRVLATAAAVASLSTIAATSALAAEPLPNPLPGGTPPTPTAWTPKYVHDAVSGGYPTYANCESTLSGLENKINTLHEGYLNGPGYPQNTENAYSPAGCWQQPDGRWTYGSLGFTLLNTSDLPMMNGYRAFKATPNTLVHFSAGYKSMDECVRYEKANLKAIYALGGKPLQAPECHLSAANDYGIAEFAFYRDIAYTTPKNTKINTADTTRTTPYVDGPHTPTWNGLDQWNPNEDAGTLTWS